MSRPIRLAYRVPFCGCKMHTSDHFSTTASLESALEAEKASHTDTLVKLRLTEERLAASEAERERLRGDLEQVTARAAHFESRADGAEDAALKLAEEILERDVFVGDDVEILADEAAERIREIRDISRARKRDSVEAEQALYKIGLAILGTDTVPGDYARLLDECATKIDHGNEALGFIKQHGDEILFLLGDGAADGPGARIHDELETLMMAIDLTACFDVTVDTDEYMSADHDEPTDLDAAVTLVKNERPGE
jgi:hypothetical protein